MRSDHPSSDLVSGFIRFAAGLLILFAAVSASAQTNYRTSVTVSQLLSAGGPVPYAQICAQPADIFGNPITISAPTWGLIPKNTPASCGSVVNGVLSGLAVPDAAHTNASGPIFYNFAIQVTNASGQPVAGQLTLITAVPNVTGSTFALDSYAPTANVPFPVSNVISSGTSVPSSCTAPSLYLPLNANQIYSCVNGVYVSSVAPASIVPPALKNRLVAEYHFRDTPGSATVADSSGNGNTITVASAMNSPTWTAGGLYFPGGSNSSQFAVPIPGSVSAVGTTYVVSLCIPSLVGSSTQNNGATVISSNSTSGIAFDLAGIWNNTPGAYGIGISRGNSGAQTTGKPQLSTGCHAFAYQVAASGTTGNDQLFMDGVEVPYGQQLNSNAYLNQGALFLGDCNGCGNTFTVNANMVVYGLYVFNASLTASEVQLLSGIVSSEALQQGASFTQTPLATLGNIVTCGVDSLSYGFPGGPSTGYCNSTNLTPIEPIAAYYDMGVTNRGLTSAYASYPYELQPYNSPIAGHKTQILWGCTNDAQGYNATGPAGSILQACVTTLAGMAQQAHKQGFKVIVLSMISRTSGLDTYKDIYDLQIRSTWQQYADGFADVANDPNIGADGANTNGYFNADHIHLTSSTGYPLVGSYVTNAYNKLYGATENAPTLIAAGTYQLLAGDNYATATVNSVLTLPNCLGYAGDWIVNVPAGVTAAVKNSVATQPISLFGAAGTDYSVTALSLAAGTKTRFRVVPGAATTAGCSWQTF